MLQVIEGKYANSNVVINGMVRTVKADVRALMTVYVITLLANVTVLQDGRVICVAPNAQKVHMDTTVL